VSRRTRNSRAAELGALFAAFAAARAFADPVPCAPIEAPRIAQLAPSEERGVLGSHVGVAEGPIVSLTAESSDEKVAQQARGEALLVLPKRPDGTLSHGYRLARGARPERESRKSGPPTASSAAPKTPVFSTPRRDHSRAGESGESIFTPTDYSLHAHSAPRSRGWYPSRATLKSP